MSTLLDAALTGAAEGARSGLPVDDLVGGSPAPEWALLLRAGAAAVHAMAGQVPVEGVPAPPTAEPDPRPPAPPGAAALLMALLDGRHPELLPEACALLSASGRRLPEACLPAALSMDRPEARAALAGVLGPRARWLAAFNPDWSRALAPGGAPTDEALERAWREGGARARQAALEAWRARAPEAARQRLREALPQEAAEARAALVSALAVGLGEADEPLLESLLDDRSPRVGREAAALLARLPRSRLVDRMKRRAEPLLRLHRPTGVLGRLMGRREALELVLPGRFSRDLARDGLTEPGELGLGPRQWWVVQLLAAVPPAHWSARLAASPEALLAAVSPDDWAVIEGWTRAAVACGDEAWLLPLWRWWQGNPAAPRARVDVWLDLLPRHLPPAQAEATARRLLSAPEPDANRLASLLEGLPRPWSEGLGRAWREAVVASVQRAGPATPDLAWWELSLEAAASGLPPALLGPPLPLPEDPARRRWRTRLASLNETLSFRRRLIEELTP